VLNTDWYGYRLLAGVLWFFAAGMLMFHLRPKALAAAALMAPAAGVALYAYLRVRHLNVISYNTEVLAGWSAGVPLVMWLGRRRSGGLDHLAGDVSYGMFLNHFLVLWLLFPRAAHGAAQLGLVVTCSFLLSWATQRLVERPVLACRRRFRRSVQANATSVT
jgi:peptidoglycan/LPS O-acetylase OafA/YrhL